MVFERNQWLWHVCHIPFTEENEFMKNWLGEDVWWWGLLFGIQRAVIIWFLIFYPEDFSSTHIRNVCRN